MITHALVHTGHALVQTAIHTPKGIGYDLKGLDKKRIADWIGLKSSNPMSTR